MNIIPIMTHPLSSAWDQPSKENILVDDNYAVMSQTDFDKLHEYSCSIPSGVYEGKMWKVKGKKWFLEWYSPSKVLGRCAVNAREILIA